MRHQMGGGNWAADGSPPGDDPEPDHGPAPLREDPDHRGQGRELRREAEKVITLAKTNDVHHRRLALTKVYDPRVVTKLFDEIGAADRGSARAATPDGQTDAPQGGRRGDGPGGAGPLGWSCASCGEAVRTHRRRVTSPTRERGITGSASAEPHDGSGGAGRGARPILGEQVRVTAAGRTDAGVPRERRRW